MQLSTFLLVLNDYMLPCFTKRFLGFDCPGCGLQRSISFLLMGNFEEAFFMYPALFTMIPLFGFLLADYLLTIKILKKINIALVIATITLILGNYILKLI